MAVVGPTASGKSSVAMAVAERLGDVELISVDSMQVYRGMDIGTAKPSATERARVPHRLLDLVSPADEFTVAEFQRAYRSTLDDLAVRGRRAILVGGTGLYHRAVIDDLDLPGSGPTCANDSSQNSPTSGRRRCTPVSSALDLDAAARMEPTNERRIVRALEVCEGSGRRFSSFGPGLDAYPPTDVVQIGLRWDRAVLTERIAARVHTMVADGLVDEVRDIRATSGFTHCGPGARLQGDPRAPRRGVFARRGRRPGGRPDPPVRHPVPGSVEIPGCGGWTSTPTRSPR
ncbi:MAG: tRNA (adenosine(37)-N6)-dimethylallyltransferase MiaA [Ilumatobacteraceae bacterium]